MNEQENGPIPGIIGQDTPPEQETTEQAVSETKPEQIFDSSSITGEENDASLVVTEKSEQKEAPKKPNIITRWQTWAIACGVILMLGIASAIVEAIIFDAKIKSAEAVGRYDSAASRMEKISSEFNDTFDTFARTTYGQTKDGTINHWVIYPEKDMLAAKEKCLSRYGVTKEDIEHISSLKTGSELLDAGKNVAEEADRLSKIYAGYDSAGTAIESCREDILAPILDKIQIELGKVSSEQSTMEGYSYITRPLTIKNKGVAISNLTLKYELVDKNGVAIRTQTTRFMKTSHQGSYIGEGDQIELDLYRDGTYRYSCNDKAVKDELSYKPRLIQISGTYAIK